MSFRRAAKIDANQPEVVKKFRQLGWSVLHVHQLKNACDLFVSKSNTTVAVEVKDGSLAPSARKLTKGELEFKEMWQGEWRLVETLADVARINADLA